MIYLKRMLGRQSSKGLVFDGNKLRPLALLLTLPFMFHVTVPEGEMVATI
jgi:hypothetical protein